MPQSKLLAVSRAFHLTWLLLSSLPGRFGPTAPQLLYLQILVLFAGNVLLSVAVFLLLWCLRDECPANYVSISMQLLSARP